MTKEEAEVAASEGSDDDTDEDMQTLNPKP